MGFDEREVIAKLKEFIAREQLEGQDVGLDEDTPLLELGLLESMSLVAMLRFVDRTWGIEVPVHLLKPENLATLRDFAALLRRIATPPATPSAPAKP